MKSTYIFLLLVSLLAISLAKSANASTFADLSNCGGKCNIHFHNHTGDTVDKGGHHTVDYTSTITVEVKNANNNKQGNQLTIVAGEQNTLNLSTSAHKTGTYIQVKSSNNQKACLNYTLVQFIVAADNDSCNVYYVDPKGIYELYLYCANGEVAQIGSNLC